jgi:hypothetical protein
MFLFGSGRNQRFLKGLGMATLIFAELNCPQAQKYADLNGIFHDLEDAKKFALRLITYGESLQVAPDLEICEALTIACLIKYSRCFGGGIRKSLAILEQGIIQSLPSKMQIDHETFLLWRDKNIAHSIDECEENQPHARYYKERPELGIVSIGCNSTTLKAMSTQDARDLKSLVEAILKKIDPLLKQEAKNLHTWAQSQPISELIAMGNPFRDKLYRIGRPRKHHYK